MYILCDKRTKGVYAVEDELKNKVVQIFVDKDDALRYYGLLEANDYKRDLMIADIDEESVIATVMLTIISMLLLNQMNL